MQTKRVRCFKTDDRAARAYAKAVGIVGRQGGWLYLSGTPVCQGYGQLAGMLRRDGTIRCVDGKWRIVGE